MTLWVILNKLGDNLIEIPSSSLLQSTFLLSEFLFKREQPLEASSLFSIKALMREKNF